MKPASITVLSILGIIFGIMGFCGLAVLALPLLPDTPGDPLVDLKKDHVYILVTSVSAVIGSLLSILLLAASIGSLRLRPWARQAMLAYAWLSIVHCLAATIVNFLVIVPRGIALIHPGNQFASILPIILYAGSCAGLIGLAYPICILYFFTRKIAIDAFNGILQAPPTAFPIQPPPPSNPQDLLFP